MSYRIESSVCIQAPAVIVWNLIQDVARRTEWDARVTAVELLTPAPVSKGALTRVTMSLLGQPMVIEIEMLTWEPPQRSAVRGIIVGSQDKVAGSWHFVANADGSTTWTTKLMIMGGGRFGRLREWLNGPITRHLTVLSQQNLKRLVEAEYRPIGVGVY